MAVNDMVVRIIGDSRSVERAFARSSTAATQFGRSVDSTGAKVDKTARSFKGFASGAATGFAGAFAFQEVANQVRAAIDVASNLQEQISKSDVIFGRSADAIQDWSKSTATNIGIARDQALEAASTFGAMFDAAGATSGDAAKFSKQMVTLAADLASFNNTSVDDALTALRAGLSGEIEPLRRFQVFLTEASVAQQAMADTGKTNAKQLTQGEKILARQVLILRATAKAQGDYARTSGNLANQQRTLAAQARDLQASIGGALVPAMTKYVTVANDAIAGTRELLGVLRDLGNVQIPVIEIPLKLVFTGLPGLGDVPGQVGRNLLPPQLRGALPFIEGILDALRPTTIPDTDAAAEAFVRDTGIGDILDQFPDKTRKIIRDKVKSFGQKGFKPLPENLLQETADRQFEETLASLSLQFDKAVLTKGTADELGILRDMERVIGARIKIHGRTTELLRQLFEVDQERRRVIDGVAADAKTAQAATAARLDELAAGRRELAEKARAAVQAAQFRALGLSTSGDEIVPGIKNLQTRIAGALRRIQSGDLDVSSKVVDRLKLARKLIKREGGKLTEDTRRVIDAQLKAIQDSSRKADATLGPITKTSALNANKILDGLGLGRDMERELRARLSSFNSAGIALAGSARPTGGFRGTVPVTQTNVTVELDGQVVARSVTRNQQKTKRRNPVQKRGSRRGGV